MSKCFCCGATEAVERVIPLPAPYNKVAEDLGLYVSMCGTCANDPRRVPLARRCFQVVACLKTGLSHSDFAETFGNDYLAKGGDVDG